MIFDSKCISSKNSHNCCLTKSHDGLHRCLCGETWDKESFILQRYIKSLQNDSPWRLGFLRRKTCLNFKHTWEVQKVIEIRGGVEVKKKCMNCNKRTIEYYWKETVR